MSGEIAASFTVFLLLWLTLSVVISLLWRCARSPLNTALKTLHAPSRANALRLIALLPLSCSVVLATNLFEFPGWVIAPHRHSQVTHSQNTHLPDTYFQHAQFECTHPLSCSVLQDTVHAPDIALSPWAPLFLAGALLPVFGLLAISLQRTRRTARQWRALSVDGDGFRVLDASLPMACAVGFFRPVIYLSRGLIERLPAAAIATIAAHERAHVRRADNLWLLLIRLGCLFWIGRNTLFDDIELAHDQACDRAAAVVVGDSLIVAETLLQCRRLAAAPAFAASFLRGHIAARVEAILNDRERALAPTQKLFLCCLWLLAIAAAVPSLHNLLESF